MAASTPPLERSPPTTTAIAIATAILAGLAGYFIGQGASIGLFSSSAPRARTQQRKEKRRVSADSDSASESESEEEEDDGENVGELSSFEGNTEEVKMVLAVRTDLKMTKGEMRKNSFLFRPGL